MMKQIEKVPQRLILLSSASKNQLGVMHGQDTLSANQPHKSRQKLILFGVGRTIVAANDNGRDFG